MSKMVNEVKYEQIGNGLRKKVIYEDGSIWINDYNTVVAKTNSINNFFYNQFDANIVAVAGNSYCSGTALATALGIYHDDPNIKPETFFDIWSSNGLINWGTEKNLPQYNDNDDCNNNLTYKNAEFADKTEDEYMDYIKNALSSGIPIIIKVKTNSSPTHFVTVVGIEDGVDIDDATFNQLVIIDPGANKENQFVSIGDSTKGYSVADNKLIVVPYIIDGKGNLVLDDKGNPITDYRQIFGDDYEPHGWIPDIGEERNRISFKDLAAAAGLNEEQTELIAGSLNDLGNQKLDELRKRLAGLSDSQINKVIVNQNSINNATNTAPVRADPIILDLNGDGIYSKNIADGTNFDFAGRRITA